MHPDMASPAGTRLQVPWDFAQDRLILPGSFVPKEPFDKPVERFLSMLRFKNKVKLNDLGLELN
jgi:hypothetical protein